MPCSVSIPDSPAACPASVPRRLRRWLARELPAWRPLVQQSAAACAADRYRKHFPAFSHFTLLLWHGLATPRSLRQSYATFATAPGLVALSGLQVDPAADTLSISYSQLAASNTSRPAAFLAGLLPALRTRVHAAGRLPAAQGPLDLRVLDSTFLRVALSLAPWLPAGVGNDQVSGVRVQVQYAPALDLPTHILITDSCTNDCQGLDLAVLDDPEQLAVLAGQTLVVDLGYYSHARLARLRAAEVHVVIRLHPQASLWVEEDLPVQTTWDSAASAGRRITVHSDQRVRVGSSQNRAGAVLLGLRLVTAVVAPTARAAAQGAEPVRYRVLTDRWDVPAEQVIQWYLWRWQIELFFRWLKSHIYLGRLLGYSENAVQMTVWLALIVHLLLVLAAHHLGHVRRSPILRAQVSHAVGHLSLERAAEDGPRARSPVQLVLPGLGAALRSQANFNKTG